MCISGISLNFYVNSIKIKINSYTSWLNKDDGDTKSLDNTNVQRLVGYTSDRPRQTGRRLPTKLSNATNAVPVSNKSNDKFVLFCVTK